MFIDERITLPKGTKIKIEKSIDVDHIGLRGTATIHGASRQGVYWGLCSNGTEIPVTKPIIYQLNHNVLVTKNVDLFQLLLKSN